MEPSGPACFTTAAGSLPARGPLTWWPGLIAPVALVALAGTLSAYLLAFLVSKRAFRFVPGEHDVHAFLEEGLETVCHLMLVLTSVIGSWGRASGRGASRAGQ